MEKNSWLWNSRLETLFLDWKHIFYRKFLKLNADIQKWGNLVWWFSIDSFICNLKWLFLNYGFHVSKSPSMFPSGIPCFKDTFTASILSWLFPMYLFCLQSTMFPMYVSKVPLYPCCHIQAIYSFWIILAIFRNICFGGIGIRIHFHWT